MDPEEKREPDWDPSGAHKVPWENRPLPEWCYRIFRYRADWTSFETYKGPEEQQRFPAWCYRLFDVFMILLAAAIVFGISGGLLFLAASRFSGLDETPESAWIKFCLGGCLGVGGAARLYFGKKPPPVI